MLSAHGTEKPEQGEQGGVGEGGAGGVGEQGNCLYFYIYAHQLYGCVGQGALMPIPLRMAYGLLIAC